LIGVADAQIAADDACVARLIHAEDREAFRATAIAAGASGQPREIDYRLHRGDGAWIHIHQLIEPHVEKDSEQPQSRWFSTLQDVTQRWMAEEQIRRLKRGPRAPRRRAKPPSSRPRNRELEAFDYSSPMTCAGRWAASRDSATPSPRTSAAGSNRSAANTSSRSATPARAWTSWWATCCTSRRSLRSEIVRANVDLTAIAERVFDALRAGEPGRDVKATGRSRPRGLGRCGAASHRAREPRGQRREFTSKRSAAVIEIGRDDQGRQAPSMFRDNGAGFDTGPRGEAVRAFPPASPAVRIQGHGHRARTVKRIIRRHGGQIEAQSAVGKGATFRFTLPD
jgi:hypothetical protein